jgi:hypothetical protein
MHFSGLRSLDSFCVALSTDMTEALLQFLSVSRIILFSIGCQY